MSWARERRRRQTINIMLSILVVIVSVAAGGLLVLLVGNDPVQAYAILFTETLGSWNKIVYTLSQSGPLVLVGLGLIIAFKGRFWNAGGEGQMLLGAILGIISTYILGEQSPVVSLTVGFAAAFFGAGAWAALSGLLKVWFKVDDIVSTLLLSQVAALIVFYIVRVPFASPNKQVAALSSVDVPASAIFPSVGGLNGIFIFAIGLSLLVYVLLTKTKLGFRVKIMGTNMNTAIAYFGRSYTNRLYVLVSFLSGGLCGMGGMAIASAFTRNMVVGATSGAYAAGGFTNSYGFIAIALVFLAGLDALASIPASIFFVVLVTGGLLLSIISNIPSSLALTISGIAMLFVAARVSIINRLNKIRGKAHAV